MKNRTVRELKKDLRKTMKQAVLQMTAEKRREEEEQCLQALINHPLWISAEVILCYLSMENEFSWDSLIDRFGKERFIAVPVIDDNRQMSFYRIRQTSESSPGPWNIRIPPPGSEVWQPGKKQTLCLTPGRAFTGEGHRMGQGGGYYDRLIIQKTALHIGTCYSVQIMKELPCEAHDQRVNGLLRSGRFTVDLNRKI